MTRPGVYVSKLLVGFLSMTCNSAKLVIKQNVYLYDFPHSLHAFSVSPSNKSSRVIISVCLSHDV